jgi:transposase
MIDENAEKVLRKKLPNELGAVKETLRPFKETVSGIVVESTFNWYWLVDGLMEEGYKVYLANPSAIKQYEGLKHTNDYDDAFHLANLLRLGILPTGYIYPKEERPIRDLLRKRSMLVRQRTSNILSFQNLYNRTTGQKIRCNEIKAMPENSLKAIFKQDHIICSAQATLSLIEFLSNKIKEIEKIVLQSTKLKAEFQKLLTIAGIGKILALTISLETGDISRFENVGNYASYCRCVQSIRYSNGKKKGENNRKNGNKNLAWAYVEGANCAIKSYPEVKRFYQKKTAATNKIVAIKATAHKLARAAYFVMRDKVDFSMEKAFGVTKNKVAAANHS